MDAFGDKRILRHNENAWHMWHNAFLSRAQFDKFPPMEEFLSKNKIEQDPQNDMPIVDKNVIIARMKAHNEKIEMEKNGSDC